MATMNEQIEREHGSITKGVERYMAAVEADNLKGRRFDGPAGQRLIRSLMDRMVPVVEAWQKEIKRDVTLKVASSTGGRPKGYEFHVLSLSAPELAYIAIRTILTNCGSEATRQTITRRIGKQCNLQLRWNQLQVAERERVASGEGVPFNRLKVMRAYITSKVPNQRKLAIWMKKLDDLTTTMWDKEVQMKVGGGLADLLLRTCPEAFEMIEIKVNRGGGIVRLFTIHMTEDTDRKLAKVTEILAEQRPWFEPMLVEPRPWAWDEEANAYTGGYIKIDEPLIKAQRHKHTQAVVGKDTVGATVLEALNRVQATPWSVNADVLQVALQAVEADVRDVLPIDPVEEMPDQFDEATWASMDSAARTEHKALRRRVHDDLNKNEAKRAAMRRQLVVAQDLVDTERFYFPHQLDFRSRVYPMPQDLNPQTNDLGRSLLKFADGKPLGNSGLLWLIYHLANSFGKDKDSREVQLAWFEDHIDLVHQLVAQPFKPRGRFVKGRWKRTGTQAHWFWRTQADDKWAAMAAAIEVVKVLASPSPKDFVSSLPVSVDGTCNGAQHLSALSRDPSGARAVNLTGSEERHDLYEVVAKSVIEKVEADAKAGNEQAQAWRGKVTRKTVKRGVMTVPYGLTAVGMRDQLMEDGFTKGLLGREDKNATYLRDCMQEAVEGNLHEATKVMRWMQKTAGILAGEGKPIDWWTPAGFLVRQAYYKHTSKRVHTVLGLAEYTKSPSRMTLEVEDKNSGIIKAKSSSSIVPNVVHSFDAAHMMMTLSAAPEDHVFSVVHDSFGVHAADMDVFLQVVKEEFVAMYSTDLIEDLAAHFKASLGTDEVELPEPPERGQFDIEEVLHASYFFS